MATFTHLIKYIVIGDSAVGKSCLLLQFTDQRFRADHDVTIGVEFGARIVTIDDHPVKLQVWDTAGQENFRSITRAYYRGSAAALLVFDVTNHATFDHIAHWLEEARHNTSPTVTLVLVGNKADLADNRTVSASEAEKFATDNHISYIETSAKTGLNVDKCFTDPAKTIMDNLKNGVYDLADSNCGVKSAQGNLKHYIGGSLKKKNCC